MDTLTTIKIFDVPEEENIDTFVNKSQREIEYEELKKTTKLDKYHFDNYYQFEILQDKLQEPDSNIISINLLYTLQYCYPIVTDITLERKQDKPKSVASALKLPTKSTMPITMQYSVPIQFEEMRRYYDIQLNTKYVEPGKQILVCGIIIPSKMARFYNEYVLNVDNYLTNQDLANSGVYGILQWLSLQYTNRRLYPLGTSNNLQKYGMNTDSDYTAILFKNEEHTEMILSFIKQYIMVFHEYYSSDLTVMNTEFNRLSDIYTKQLQDSSEPTKPWTYNFVAKNDILTSINTISKDKFNYTYNIGMLNQLFSNDLFYLYNIGRFLTTNNDFFKDSLVKYEKNNKYKQDLLVEYNNAFIKKLEIIKKHVIAQRKYKRNYNQLSKKEKEMIDREYVMISDEDENSVKTRELFALAVNSLNNIESTDLRKYMKEIHALVKKDDLLKKQMLPGGVCTHTYLVLSKNEELFGKPWLNSDLRTELINQYSGYSDIDGYYCKICGEMIAEAQNEMSISFLTQDKNRYVDIPDEIQSMIFKECLYILSSYVRFSIPVPLKPIVSAISNGLREVIAAQHRLLLKNRANTNDTIKDILIIYINIYAYACLCAMMMTSDKIRFGKEKSNEETKVNTDIREKKYEKKRGRGENYVDIDEERSDDSDNERSEESDESYVNIDEQSNDGEESKERSESDESYVNIDERSDERSEKSSDLSKKGGLVTKDIKFYERFILTTSLNLIMLNKDAVIRRTKSINFDIIKEVFLKVAYKWAKSHIKSINIVNTTDEDIINNSDTLTQYVAYVSNIKSQEPKTVFNVDSKNPDKNYYANMKLPPKPSTFNDYQYESFKSLYEYLKNGVWLAFADSEPFRAYYEKFKFLKDIEYERKQYKAMWKVSPNYRLILLNDLLKYNDFDIININRFYCPSGEKHKVGSFVYRNNGKEVEFKKSDITDMVKSGKITEIYDLEYVGEKCEKCDQILETIDTYDPNAKNSKFDTMLTKKNDIAAFYEYYTVRCPEGDLHEYKGDICVKCKFNSKETEAAKKNVKNTDPYFTKYITKFKEIEKIQNKLAIESLNQIITSLDDSEKYDLSKYSTKDKTDTSDYIETFNNIAEWSQLFGIKYNILINIGLIEQYKFAEIAENKINPSREEYNYVQVMRVKMYIFETVREYNNILNYQYSSKVPLAIKALIDEQKKTNFNFSTKELYQLPDDYLKLDDRYRRELDLKLYINFNLDYLARLILNISKNNNQKYKSIAHSLGEHFTTKIMNEEVMFSKPKPLVRKSSGEEKSDTSQEEKTEDSAIETANEDNQATEEEEENLITLDHFDVENADDVWETE